MKHVVHHGLGLAMARKVADAAFASYKQRFAEYHPEARWVDERRAEITFRVKGMTLEGAIDVSERDIEMELEVPFLLRPFKGKAIGIIEDEIQTWVARAKQGEL